MLNYLKQPIIVFMLLVLFTTGCAHQKSSTPLAAPPPDTDHQKTTAQVIVAATETEQTPQDAPDERITDEFADDDLDFLDELDAEDEASETETASVYDPFYSWNKAMFHFNDKFYFWFAKPVAQGYKAAVPYEIRDSLRNFFFNIFAPVRLTNCVLQGKFTRAGAEFGRFFVNSTAGVLGLGNPAKNFPSLNPPSEDMGQTLGTYGIGNGPYLVLPIIGPSTLRDALGMFTDRFVFNPLSYTDTFEFSLGLTTTNFLNDASFQIGDYDAFKNSAIEPYEAMRNFYIQYRNNKLND
jgi:phospholipid-binding lipoprotein MlaA